MKKIIVTMPVANEEATMANILDRILSLPYDDLYVYPVMDKYSTDSTESIIDEYESKTNHRVHKVFFEQSTGTASCYMKGYEEALKDNADYVIEMDGGGSHAPEEIPRFVEKLEQGYACVWGSRFIDGGVDDNMPFYRRFLSRGGTFLANFVLHTKLCDMTSGFEAYQADVLRQFDYSKFLSKGHMFQTEMRFYCRNCQGIEIPIHYVGSSSSLKASTVTRALGILFKLKANEVRVNRHLSE
ncbi:MAG: glycosyltransferase family 2 protein [Proteobacteria bacterium]|nr:glycosyltransferase family 2 protein [Pseudomonadota bacterium]